MSQIAQLEQPITDETKISAMLDSLRRAIQTNLFGAHHYAAICDTYIEMAVPDDVGLDHAIHSYLLHSRNISDLLKLHRSHRRELKNLRDAAKDERETPKVQG